MSGTARLPIAGDVDFTQSHIKAAKQALLTKLRDEVMKDKELTDPQIFIRDMSKMFCGCSFSGYVRCEGHKDKPIPERWFTRSEVLALLEKEMNGGT